MTALKGQNCRNFPTFDQRTHLIGTASEGDFFGILVNQTHQTFDLLFGIGKIPGLVRPNGKDLDVNSAFTKAG